MKPKPLFLLTILIFPLFLLGENQTLFTAKKIGKLPVLYSDEPNPGVAGAFSGISEDKLIIAGGANFPDQKPWEGGIKTFCDRIYVYTLTEKGLIPIDRHWSLPEEVAYGASVTTPGGVLAIGGNNREKCFQSVRLLKWNPEKNDLNIEDYPNLPIPVSYGSAVLLDHSVYVVGGSGSTDSYDTGNHFFKLDISKHDQIDFAWEELSPFPGEGRVFTVAVAQSNGNHPCIFLFSGRNVTGQNGITVFQDGLVYDPDLKTWERLASANSIDFPVMAGTAFASGKSEIVFFGGAPADLLYQEVNLKKELKSAISSRDSSSISQAREALIGFYTGHPGFSKDILVYNIQTKTLSVVGKLDGYCPVTTSAVPYKKGAIIVSGEIKPGIRTPEIIQISPVKQSSFFSGTDPLTLIISFIGLVAIVSLFLKNKRKQLARKE